LAAGCSGSGSGSEASWQLEVFGTWKNLTDAESAQIEKAYSDPNNNSVVTSVAVSRLPLVFSIIVIVITTCC